MPQPTNSNKKRIIKDYENLPEEIISRVKMEYPYGFANNLVSFTNKEGKRVSALPFETEDIYYLIRMTVQEARQIISDDDDYDDEGNLRDSFAGEDAAADAEDNFDDEAEEKSPYVDKPVDEEDDDEDDY
jgi:DNA-directed RNA polymerase subunit delta